MPSKNSDAWSTMSVYIQETSYNQEIQDENKTVLSTADWSICSPSSSLVSLQLGATYIYIRRGVSYASLVECLRCTNMNANMSYSYHLKYFSFLFFSKHSLNASFLFKAYIHFIHKLRWVGLYAHPLTHPRTHPRTHNTKTPRKPMVEIR